MSNAKNLEDLKNWPLIFKNSKNQNSDNYIIKKKGVDKLNESPCIV